MGDTGTKAIRDGPLPAHLHGQVWRSRGFEPFTAHMGGGIAPGTGPDLLFPGRRRNRPPSHPRPCTSHSTGGSSRASTARTGRLTSREIPNTLLGQNALSALASPDDPRDVRPREVGHHLVAETRGVTSPTSVPGWILTRGAASDHRCIALAGRGTPPAASGTQIHVDEALLRTTFNHHVLAVGLAYPTYYTNLFSSWTCATS